MPIREAVVLAAGEGRRLRPLTRHRPKPMLPAANRPLLEYVFDALIDAGIQRLVTVVGYKRDRVQNHFGSTYRDVPVDYVHQRKQLGSGHALLCARGDVEGSFLVVNGDQIAARRMAAEVIEAAEGSDAVVTLAAIEREAVGRYGVVELDGDRVTSFVEKPDADTSHLLNAGVYAVDERVFEALEATERTEGTLALSDTIAHLIGGADPVCAVRTGGLWIDATYPWDLLAVAAELLSTGWLDVPEREPGVWVDPSARVHEAAHLFPPVAIGPDCVVGPGAVVGPDVALGRNVTVGANVTVARSVLDDDTRLDAGATVLDCVAGQRVRLGAGSIVTGGTADVVIAGEVHEDQRLGAVLADRVIAEGAVSIAPGSLVGPNAVLHAGCTVSGTVPEDAEVVR